MNEPTRQAYSVVLIVTLAVLAIVGVVSDVPASEETARTRVTLSGGAGAHTDPPSFFSVDLSEPAVEYVVSKQSVPIIRVGEIEIARYLMLCPAEGQASEMWGGALTGSTPSLHEIHDQPPDSKCVVYDLSLCEPTMTLVTPPEKPYVPKAKR